MNICVLGRQPELGIAELEQLFGSATVQPFAKTYAFVDGDVAIDTLGGTIKTATHLTTLPTTDPQKVFDYYRRELPKRLAHLPEGKLKLGVSVYGSTMPLAKINANALSLKKAIKNAGRSVRVVPNTEPTLSSAQSLHNNLAGALGMELIFIKNGNETVVGQLTGVQNIDAYAARDQARPKTDAFVGMLPPKLALMMVNLAMGSGLKSSSKRVAGDGATPSSSVRDEGVDRLTGPAWSDLRGDFSTEKSVNDGSGDGSLTLLDPFCGTGVVLQEAALRGLNVYGTDLSEKMIDYSTKNLAWAKDKYNFPGTVTIHHGDAIETQWQPPIHAVASEVYLGQPFSAPPSPDKLTQVRGICNDITKRFLLNLAPQIKKGTPLCIAVPAWRDGHGYTTYLQLIPQLEELGYEFVPLQHTDNKRLLYYREDQVVARQLLVLKRG